DGLIPDKDRLYASLDEFLLEPGSKGQRDDFREPNIFPDPNSRTGRGRNVKFIQDQLERSKFFLSVVSRAPETTMFNTPRVSIWPTQDPDAPGFKEELNHSPFDTLIRYCAQAGASTGGEPFIYHFQRAKADSSTWDYAEIDRNEELMDYLDKLTSSPIPGLGESFDKKYSNQERRQILTEIFDYIRSTNLHDDSLYGDDWEDAFTTNNTDNNRTFTNPRKKDLNPQTNKVQRATHKGHGQVTPIDIDWHGANETKGFGRFTTLYEIGVHVICSADGGRTSTDGDDTGGTKGGPEPGREFVGGKGQSYPGIRKYPSGYYIDPNRQRVPGEEDVHLSNFPPMPDSVNVDQEKYVLANGQPDYNTPYNVKSIAWSQWPDWMRKMVEPQYKRDPAVFGTGVDNINGEHDPRQYAPEYIFKAFDQKRWNWQLAWLDQDYANAMPLRKFDRGALSDGAWKGGETRLATNEQVVQAQLLFMGFCPSLGWVPINPDMEMDIGMTGFTFAGGGVLPDELAKEEPPGPAPLPPNFYRWSSNNIDRASHIDRHYGGTRAWNFYMRSTQDRNKERRFFDTGLGDVDTFRGIGRNGRRSPIDFDYKEVENFNHYQFMSRPWKINNRQIEFEGGDLEVQIFSAGTDSSTQGTATSVTRQKVQTIEVEFPSFVAPSPILSLGYEGYRNEFNAIQHGPITPVNLWSLSGDGINPELNAGRLALADSDGFSIATDQDVLKSMVVGHGDARLVAALKNVPKEVFQPSFNYDNHNQRAAHSFRTTAGGALRGNDTGNERQLVPGVSYNPRPLGTGSSKSSEVQLFGDFDNGFGLTVDGPYINKPDEGNTHSLFEETAAAAAAAGAWDMSRKYGDFPYFVRDYIHEAATPAFFSPNRIICSPVQFGSLSVGVYMDADGTVNRPWRTLLFRPDLKSGKGSGHPGAITPPDHYLLDLFWMPAVEPYAISEPLSTGGKVNLNYQILPFKHITRSTALRGVFKAEYMLCVPDNLGQDYKYQWGVGRGRGYHWRDSPFGGKLQQKSLRAVILEDHTLYQ
ncbi:MAG: Verru_Chthon cassette protein A, partial [Nitrospira sp.]|nr:Verru_Chthon cassette protein A [Nitrospira sp.]